MNIEDCSGTLYALLDAHGNYTVALTLKNLIAAQVPDYSSQRGLYVSRERMDTWNMTKELLKETKPMPLSAQQALQQAHKEFAIHWPAKQAVLDKGDNLEDMTRQDLTGNPSPYEAVKAERETWVDARVKFLLWIDMQPLGIVNGGAMPATLVNIGTQKS